MPQKDFKSKKDFQLALQIFEEFKETTQIPANTNLAKWLGIKKDHPMYQTLNGKTFNTSLERNEVAKILEQRKLRRPAKLNAQEIKGKQGYLLAPSDQKEALSILAEFPEINIIPQGKTIGEVLKEKLSTDRFSELHDSLKEKVFQKTIIRDTANNVFVASASTLGKGAFGEVVIAQAIQAGPDTKGLENGQYVAMKKQHISDENREEIEAEFSYEQRATQQYHFGHVEGGENVYSFIRMVTGGELKDWVKKDLLHIQKGAVVSRMASDDISSEDMDFLFDHERWLERRELEREAFSTLEGFESKILELEKIAEGVDEIAEEFRQMREPSEDDVLDIKNKLEVLANGRAVKFTISRDSDNDIEEIEFEIDQQWEELYDTLNDFAKKSGHGLESVEDKTGVLFKRVKTAYSILHSLSTSVKSELEPNWGSMVIDKEAEHKKIELPKEKLKDEIPTKVRTTNAAIDDIDLVKFMKMCEGVAGKVKELHDCGVLHRDLKSENVLIDGQTLEPFLIDFGVSLTLDEQKMAKSTIAGSPGHWPPEAYRAESSEEVEQSTAFDLYSLGATYQNMLLPILRRFVPEDQHDNLKKGFAELTHVMRLKSLRLDNPNSDPRIDALNKMLIVIDNIKKVNPDDRKGIDYVINQLHTTRVELARVLEKDALNRSSMHEALKDVKFSGNTARDLFIARTHIETWNSRFQSDASKQITPKDYIINQVVSQVVDEQMKALIAQEKEQKRLAEQQKVEKWSKNYDQRRYEENVKEIKLLKKDNMLIDNIDEEINRESDTYQQLVSIYEKMEAIGLLYVEKSGVENDFKLMREKEEPSIQDIEQMQEKLINITDAMRKRNNIKIKQITGQVERYEDKKGLSQKPEDGPASEPKSVSHKSTDVLQNSRKDTFYEKNRAEAAKIKERPSNFNRLLNMWKVQDSKTRILKVQPPENRPVSDKENKKPPENRPDSNKENRKPPNNPRTN